MPAILRSRTLWQIKAMPGTLALEGGSNECLKSLFLRKLEKYHIFASENSHFYNLSKIAAYYINVFL